MITIHWTYILAAVVLVIGVGVFIKMAKEDSGSYMPIGGAFGCTFFIITVLIVFIIGGIFWW